MADDSVIVRNKTPEAQLELLATKFASIKDGADKDAMLLGRAGVNLIPIFNQGAEGFKWWFDVSKEFGTSLSKETTAQLLEMHHALIKVNDAIVGTSIQAFVGLKGALLGASQLVKDLVAGFANAAREGGAAASAVQILDGAMKGLVAGLVTATAAIKEMWATFSFGAEVAGMWLNEIITQITNLETAVKNLSFAGVKDEWSFFQDQVTQRTRQFKNDILSANSNMQKELHTIFAQGDKKIEAETSSIRSEWPPPDQGERARPTTTRWRPPARKSRER